MPGLLIPPNLNLFMMASYERSVSIFLAPSTVVLNGVMRYAIPSRTKFSPRFMKFSFPTVVATYSGRVQLVLAIISSIIRSPLPSDCLLPNDIIILSGIESCNSIPLLRTASLSIVIYTVSVGMTRISASVFLTQYLSTFFSSNGSSPNCFFACSGFCA